MAKGTQAPATTAAPRGATPAPAKAAPVATKGATPAATTPAGPGSVPASPTTAKAPAAVPASPTTAAAPDPNTPVTRDMILGQLDGKLPGHTEGTAKLADAWLLEKINAETLASRIKEPGLWSKVVGAWSGHGAHDEAFVQEFGKNDPIAIQKFAELAAEKYYDGDLAAARKGFYSAVALQIAAAPTPRDRVFPILSAKRLPFTFKGKKIEANLMPDFVNRTHGVAALPRSMTTAGQLLLQDYTVRKISEKSGMRPERVRLKPELWQDFDTNKALRAALRDQSLQPLQVVDLSKKVSDYATWFSPEQAKVVPDGEAGYAELMTIGALQPEWYPDGTVQLNIKPDKAAGVAEARKPTAFDGLLSAVWVARNQQDQTYGVTGGGAREFLMTGVTWGEVAGATAQVPGDDFLTEIQRLSERFKKVDGVASTPGEEILRGKHDPTGRTRGMYQDMLGTTAKEANDPSKVSDQVAPGGGGTVAVGGTHDMNRLQTQTGALPGSHAP